MAFEKDNNSILMVPVKLDALFVPEEGITVVEPFVNFEKLPYSKKVENKWHYENTHVPYISETVLSKPLADKNYGLQSGIHLHWTLPDALTKATFHRNMAFPAVPNRWMVMRYRGDSDTPEKKWIVLSDYLWPVNTDFSNIPETIQPPMVAFHHQKPFDTADTTVANNHHLVPFRYLGWVSSFEDTWEVPDTDPDNYLNNLTAIGYGEPLFSAFYPNCQGVFGIHDKDIQPSDDLRNIRYEVYGWYSDLEGQPSADILSVFANDHAETNPTDVSWSEKLEEELAWTLAINAGDKLPERTVCFAQISFTKAQAPPELDILTGGAEIEVGVGNTSTEALSAYLSQKMSPYTTDQARIENQLESLHLRPHLHNQHTDLKPIFEEARHSNSFHSVSGGFLWSVKIETAQEAGLDQLRDIQKDKKAANLFLPSDIFEKIEKVNQLQEEYYRYVAIKENVQRQIFSDWQKYMRASYHDPLIDDLTEGGKPFPDIELAKKQVERLVNLHAILELYTLPANPNSNLYSSIGMKDFEDLKHLIPESAVGFSDWAENYIKYTDQIKHPLTFQIKDLLWEINQAFEKRRDNLMHYFRGWYINFFTRPPKDWDPDQLGVVWDFGISREDFIQQEQLTIAQIRILIQNWYSRKKSMYIEALGSKESISKMLDNFEANEDAVAGATAANAAVMALLTSVATTPILSLEKIAAPRYWESNEPVLLIAGPAAETTNRHGMDGANHERGFLTCQRLAETPQNNVNAPVLPFIKLHNFSKTYGESGQIETDGMPWHSLFLEWEVKLDPMRKHSNLDPEKNDFSGDFLSTNYSLEETQSEFLVRISDKIDEIPDLFSGRSTMTPFASQKLIHEIEQYLVTESQEYLQALQAANDPSISSADTALLELSPLDETFQSQWLSYFDNHQQDIVDFYNARLQTAFEHSNQSGDGDSLPSKSTLQTTLEAREKIRVLENTGSFVQTQNLTGFNKALLMLHETYQLEIAEPNGFEEYRNFSESINQVVDGKNHYTGFETGAFHPFRTGRMHFNRLRLVDTFGRIFTIIDKDAEPEYVPPSYAPQRMLGPVTGEFELAPRITQPARLHFRWISAEGENLTSNAHPTTSPICGWVLPNHLDLSLMIYASDGQPLGYIEQTGRWRVFPGKKHPMLPEAIDNKGLRKMVLWLIGEAETVGDSFIEHFIKDIESIMADIAPDSYAQHSAKNLLMGKPMVLVQAAIDIHLQNWPAVRQDTASFKEVIQGKPYIDEGFTNVEIPIRIGERQRLNDGLVCYWLDEDEGYKDGHFFAPFSQHESDLKSFESNQITFHQALNAPSQRLSILMDPRALLHCTTGILPTKALSIPLAYVKPALERLQISFLSAPLLSEPNNLTLSLPEEAGYTWSWIQKDENNWRKLTTTPTIRKIDVESNFQNGSQLWISLIQKGWIDILEHHPNLAHLRKPQDRAEPNLIEIPTATQAKKAAEALQSDMEATLMHLSSAILLPSEAAHFGEAAEIREGWLTLQPIK